MEKLGGGLKRGQDEADGRGMRKGGGDRKKLEGGVKGLSTGEEV